MAGGMKLSELDFVRLLPAFMRDDEAVRALSKAVDHLIGEPGMRLHTLSTWDKIDELNEAECDELSWELDIDWYDSAGMSLEEKRETIRMAQQIKRKRGTRWAVERLIASYIGEGYVAEWYETGAAPYTFTVLITSTTVDEANYEKFVEATNFARNERSHIAGIYYYWPEEPAIEYGTGAKMLRYEFEKCGTSPRPATVGMLTKAAAETEPEVAQHLYTFDRCGQDGIKARLGAAIVGTAIVGTAILRD